MNYLTRLCLLICIVAVLFLSVQVAQTTSQSPQPQDPAQKEKRGVGIEAASPSPTPKGPAPDQTTAHANQPDIVLQAGITSPQTEIRFSPDGRLLASMGMTGNDIKLWEVASGRLLRQLQSSIPSMGASSMTRPFRFSADGRTLVTFAEGRLRRWDVESGRELNNTLLPTAKDFFVALLSEDGRLLAALNLDSSAARLWDTATGRELRPITFNTEEHLADQDSIALSPDGKLLAALTTTVKGSSKGIETKQQLTVWETSSGRNTTTLKVKQTSTQFSQGLGQIRPEQVISLAFSPDGAWLAVRDDNSLKIWDVASGRELKSFNLPSVLGPQSDPMFIMLAGKFLFSPDKQTISMASEGSRIDLFDVSTTNKLRSMAPQAGKVVSLSYSPDGKLLASSLTDNQIKLWEIATGREVITLSGAAMPISDLAFARDGKSLAIAGQQAVSSWELSTGGVRRAVDLPDAFARSAQNGLL